MVQERTVGEQNRIAREEKLAHLRAVRDAFVATFGPPGNPHPPAAIVLDYLEAYSSRSAFKIAKDLSGQTDVPATFARFGIRDAIDRIHYMINWKESDYAHGSGSTE